MTPKLRKLLFETLYRNRHLYRFASTVPFAGQWRVWQRLILPRLHGQKVLEIGCGLGDLLADMLEAGYNCQAIEHSPAMVAAARKTLHKRRLGNITSVIQGSAQSLPFSNQTFDSIVSTFPSDYICDPQTISEIARVLKPGGRLLIITGANLYPVGLLQPFLLPIHMLVYGRRGGSDHSLASQTPQPAKDENIIETIEESWFGMHIPLEIAGLQRTSQRIYNRRWEVFLTIGDKPETREKS